MRADTIMKLAWYKPRSKKATRLYTCNNLPGMSGDRAAKILHYAECHNDLQFGWNFAAAMQESHIPFPALLKGDDLYVWRAYQYLKGKADSIIEAASSFMLPMNSHLKDSINAMLVTDGMDHDTVASVLCLNRKTVVAYEKLFFNVLDRKKDRAFMANLIYPEGRLVEGFDSYLENTGMGDLLMRAGYAHGLNHVLYAVGLGKHPYAEHTVNESANELDSKFMADGFLYALLGWSNQRKNAVPISNARLSLNASKMGGSDPNADASSPFGIGDAAKDELIKMAAYKAEVNARNAMGGE